MAVGKRITQPSLGPPSHLSPHSYVLPNHMLFQISEILPRESQGILACCNPIPTLLRQQIQELFHLVQQAREVSLTGPLPLPAVAGSPSPAEGTGASPGPSVRSTSSEVLQRMGVRVPATAVLPVPELPQKISLGSPAHEAKEERGEGESVCVCVCGWACMCVCVCVRAYGHVCVC